MTSQRVLACTSGVLFSLGVLASSAAGQAPPAKPKPGPEHAQLKYFVGKWTTEGDMKASPIGPAGKFTTSDNCELFSGGFFVVCHSNGKGPSGPMHELGVLGYDTMKKAFTYSGFSNDMPSVEVAQGKHERETWVYTETMDLGEGKKMQGRYTMTDVTPSSYAFKFEMAPEGSSDWSTIMEGKSTRVAAPTKAPADTANKETEGTAKKATDAATAKKP
jgi:hypothetical protein